jgi:hypothetical protein
MDFPLNTNMALYDYDRFWMKQPDEEHLCGSCKRDKPECAYLHQIGQFICPECCNNAKLYHWQRFCGTGEILHYVLKSVLTPSQVQMMHSSKTKKKIERRIFDLLPKLNSIYWTGNSGIILRSTHNIDLLPDFTLEVQNEITELFMLNLYEVHGHHSEYNPKEGTLITIDLQLLMCEPEKITKHQFSKGKRGI